MLAAKKSQPRKADFHHLCGYVYNSGLISLDKLLSLTRKEFLPPSTEVLEMMTLFVPENVFTSKPEIWNKTGAKWLDL
jgi:hypothetical protein